MRLLASMLVMMFIIIYWNSNSHKSLTYPRKRTFWFTCLLAFLVVLQMWFMSAPIVDYGALGWSGHIREINRVLAGEGNPNRLPEPAEN